MNRSSTSGAAIRPSRIVLALTGTDVYRDIHLSGEAQESLERADRLIVLQPKAADELAPRLRGKVRVVVQSSSTGLRHKPVKEKFRLCVIGHLREEKDPLRTLAALRFLSKPDAGNRADRRVAGSEAETRRRRTSATVARRRAARPRAATGSPPATPW